ncbi:serine hydrolase [Zavarzinella formosa]|uniref:serine hydrolase n=1 Tax=Zavarzinella formosa TaxID=360055 RepID=UPI000317E72B|nr:serine hydrolase [Zavarzinella formosa]
MTRLCLLAALTVMAVCPVTRGQESVQAEKKYADVIRSLEPFIIAEMKAKDAPGLSIAIVDGDRIVWARGFGESSLEKKKPATAETQYPLGSVSKLFTALLALQLARDGKLDLDAPVTKYLADFKPKNSFNTPVKIRHLLAHCSGIVREPPVGNCFFPGKATRAELVASLNDTELIHQPGTQYKYSNAAFALAGHLIETADKKSFEDVAETRIFQPLGMTHTSFRLTDPVRSKLAVGQGWTRYGKTFPWPTHDYLALGPAGGLHSSVLDIGKFIPALYSSGKPFHPDDLKTAFTPQFPGVKAERTYGIGFMLSEFQGKKKVSHGGAVNGCATEFAVLPEEQLGVIVCANLDSANMLTRRIADATLGQMLALKAGQPLSLLRTTASLPAGAARKLDGRYQSGDKQVEVMTGGDRAWLIPSGGGTLKEIRSFEESFITDDALSYGTKIGLNGGNLKIDGKTYERMEITNPQPAPDRWQGLIGEYGTDSNVLFVLEKDGQLHLLIEWFYLCPLTEEGPDQFRLSKSGLYPGEAVVFHRKPGGKATAVTAAAMKFDRRQLDGEDGATFKIKPNRSIDDIRKEAFKATPPVEKGEFRKPDLVDLATVDPAFKFDIRYATDNNFMSTPLYSSAKAFVQRPAAEALKKANKKLAEHGYGILFFDCYRPWHITKMFWEATPENQRIFVADPSKGSRHNRGCATDITLYDLKTGKPVEMVSGFDEFSDRSYPDYMGGTSLQRWHRKLLRDTMESEGFTVYEAEWWHYDFGEWRKYPILNDRYEDLK